MSCAATKQSAEMLLDLLSHVPRPVKRRNISSIAAAQGELPSVQCSILTQLPRESLFLLPPHGSAAQENPMLMTDGAFIAQGRRHKLVEKGCMNR